MWGIGVDAFSVQGYKLTRFCEGVENELVQSPVEIELVFVSGACEVDLFLEWGSEFIRLQRWDGNKLGFVWGVEVDLVLV